jgi:hypothetical protein
MSTDPLRGSRAKIDRANETIEKLDVEISAFLQEHFHAVVTDPNEHRPDYVLTATGKKPLDRFAVIIGEIVHHLRSALDHLVWPLVLANHATPHNRNEFPVCGDWREFVTPQTKRKIQGVSVSAAALIESAQPYQRGAAFSDDPLWILHGMDITDKHRLLVVTKSKVSLPSLYVNRFPEDFSITSFTDSATLSSNASAELAVIRPVSFDPQMKVSTHVVFEIVFPEFGSAKDKAVIPSLAQLSRFTSRLIDQFVGEF